jgi:DNA invertase Pin-like site-specific DNA recombinase
MIRERQREGVAAAKRAGKHCGRKATLSSHRIAEVGRVSRPTIVRSVRPILWG